MGRRKLTPQPEGRKKYRRVLSLQKYLKGYGPGEDARREREAFAARVGTTLPYLTHVGLGNRRVSMELAVRIERATYGSVRVEDLRPSSDWEYLRSRHEVVRHA